MSRELTAFIEAWREAGPALEELRDRDLIEVPVTRAMADLEGMFQSALHLEPLAPTSGLVAMQEVFARLRACAR